MPLLIDGVEIEEVTIDGVVMETVNIDGVEVFTAFTHQWLIGLDASFVGFATGIGGLTPLSIPTTPPVNASGLYSALGSDVFFITDLSAAVTTPASMTVDIPAFGIVTLTLNISGFFYESVANPSLTAFLQGQVGNTLGIKIEPV